MDVGVLLLFEGLPGEVRRRAGDFQSAIGAAGDSELVEDDRGLGRIDGGLLGNGLGCRGFGRGGGGLGGGGLAGGQGQGECEDEESDEGAGQGRTSETFLCY